MQIVIDIPKDAYDYVMGSGYFPHNFNMISEIRNGTVLPKHGRLIDVDTNLKGVDDPYEYDYWDKADTILEAWENEE